MPDVQNGCLSGDRLGSVEGTGVTSDYRCMRAGLVGLSEVVETEWTTQYITHRVVRQRHRQYSNARAEGSKHYEWKESSVAQPWTLAKWTSNIYFG